MILADTSVWIDYLRAVPSWQAERLDQGLEIGEIIMGDLILLELLQGFGSERELRRAITLFDPLATIQIADRELAVEAAKNYRHLRGKGITVRSSIDTLIATRCIADDLQLLHSDRDYLAFERELGLRVISATTH